MAEYPDPNETGKWPPQGAPAPRKSSDVLTDRLMQLQLRQRAAQAERLRDEVVVRNQELREQVDALHVALERSARGVATVGHGEIEALRQELERVRAQAAADLEALQRQLSKKSRGDAATRNVELEAELQAVRQETAVLRQAVKEKDKVLEELAVQCQSLEDALEDRDREMDRLHQDLEQSRRGGSALSGDSGTSVLGVDCIDQGRRDSAVLYAFQEKYASETINGAGLVSSSSRVWSRRTILFTAAAGLLLGVLVLTVVLLRSDWGRPSLGDTAVVREPLQPQPSADASAALGAGPQSRTTATVGSNTSESAQVSSSAVLVRDLLRNGSQGPLLVAISGGVFVMGNKHGPLNNKEQPAHQVELRPYFIGKYEVTFAQYDVFARLTGRRLPNDFGWGRGEWPVIDITWDDALAYTRWLSEQTGKRYRLPSEAEWEYAARSGSTYRYWWGANPGGGRAVCFNCGSQWDNRSTAPVGSLAPNPYGLHDTAGNVMEWVADCYNPSYRGAPEDGGAWLSGDCSQRMVRGGAFNKPSSSLRSAARYQLHQDSRFNMLGFRVVRE